MPFVHRIYVKTSLEAHLAPMCIEKSARDEDFRRRSNDRPAASGRIDPGV